MTTYANSNLSLVERAKLCPQSFISDELADLFAELNEYRKLAADNGCDDARDIKVLIDDLEGDQANPDHADYDDLKSFFNDCVESLNSRWLCAEAYDLNLRQVICEAIAKGDTERDD